MEAGTGDIGAGDPVAEISSGEHAMVEDLFGRQAQKGALKRGFKSLPRILPYLRPFRRKASLSVILTVLMAVVALAEPWPLAFVVDSIVGDEPAPGWVEAIFGSSVGALIALAVLATLFLVLFSGLLEVWNEYLTTTVDQRMVLNFRSEMFEHAQQLSLAFHDTESKGILMYRINDQAVAMGQIVTALPVLGQHLLTIVGMAIITVLINPLLALLALGITPFIIYSTTFYTNRIEPRLYRVRGLGAINLAIVYEAMMMMRVVLAFGGQRREYKKFRDQGENWADEVVGLTVRQTVFKLAVQMITAAGTAAVIGVGAWQAVNGQISAGELLVVLSYIASIYLPLEQLTNTITSFQQWFINLLMSFDLMDMEPTITEREDARPLERARGEVELEGVGFSYAERPHVLKDVSLRIPAGRAVALVGPTGAGKSTMVSLLPRFHDAEEGTVRIDGNDVRELKVPDVRSQFSIVLQEPLLFSGSIANNIRYGKPDASMEEVVEAAEAANAHEFISDLPDGYETFLGEGGAKISGGERQRIAVARAFLRDAPILILDEPTSAIDSRTEAVILDALDRLMEGRTTIMIAHRLSTIRSVDEIVVMDHGAIVQRGSHEELSQQAGLYRQLWDAQTRAQRSREQPVSIEPAQATPLAPVTRVEPRPAKPALVQPQGLAPGVTAALPRPKIVLLGMLTKIPVGGVGWLVGHYAMGFERLGYEVYYVEAHARTPSMFMQHEGDDGAGKAAAYIARTAARFGLEDRWAFQALHENGRCYGMSAEELDALYRDAALIINMHGGTLPLPEHAATDRLVFLGTDPVEVELEVEREDKRALEFLDQHVAHFTWGLNYGNPDCTLPWARPYSFVPSPPPVVLDLWENTVEPDGPFTTIGNWRQRYRDVQFRDRVFRWSKHQQFMKILDLPSRTQVPIELALSSYDGRDRMLLAEHGWRVRPGLELSRDLDSYRDYIVNSSGEVSAAKEQNVHFRTGWFSERSVTYLAAGRPVIVQDTGFGAALPTGDGLFGFVDVDGAAAAVEAAQSDPKHHRRAAGEIAREYLSHEVVLGDMLDHVGLRRRAAPKPYRKRAERFALPADLRLEARARRADRAAEEYVLRRPVPAAPAPGVEPVASVVVSLSDNLASTRLTLESVLLHTDEPPYELLVVDNGSTDPIREYLEVLQSRNRQVQVIRNRRDLGFAAGCSEALAAAKSEILVLLIGGTVIAPGWLTDLVRHLEDPKVGLVEAASNLSVGAGRGAPGYETYGDFMRFARTRRQELAGNLAAEIESSDTACVAIRRGLLEEVGPPDAAAGEFDAAFAGRIRQTGQAVVRAEEVFVHRFGDRPDSGREDQVETAPDGAEAGEAAEERTA